MLLNLERVIISAGRGALGWAGNASTTWGLVSTEQLTSAKRPEVDPSPNGDLQWDRVSILQHSGLAMLAQGYQAELNAAIS